MPVTYVPMTQKTPTSRKRKPLTEEHEIKVLDIELRSLKRILRQLGAKRIFKGMVTTLYYEDPSRPFYKRGETCRIRQVGDEVELTYKRRMPGSGVKSRQELSFEAESIEEAEVFLKRMGLQPTFYHEKERESYSLNNCRIDYDVYPGVPPFLEIEGASARKIFTMIKQLGLQEHRTSTLGVISFLRRYFPKVDREHMEF